MLGNSRQRTMTSFPFPAADRQSQLDNWQTAEVRTVPVLLLSLALEEKETLAAVGRAVANCSRQHCRMIAQAAAAVATPGE